MAKTLQDPRVLGGCVYYSQNREDLVLLSFFPDVKKGFYVDVGAFDPDEDSVTKLFYREGWRGINIEPQPDRYKIFEQRRERDTNLNLGIAIKEGELTLRSYKSQGLSTFSEKIKAKYADTPEMDTSDYVEHKVAVRPLRDVLAASKVPHIHFMKVDVEGLEYEVLKSNDWSKFRPEVLCIEANHVEQDWRPLLKDENYELVFDDGLNEYYVDRTTDRKQKFDYVEQVVRARGGGIRADHYELTLGWYNLALDKSHHVEELTRSCQDLTAELERVNARLKTYNSIKGTARRLLALVKRNAAQVVKKR